jgi:hypothetical protein
MSTIAHRAAFGFAALAIAVTALPSAAIGADDEQKDSAYIEALKACQRTTDDAARLACFDRAVASVVSANDQGELRVVDREAVRQTRRKLFGFALPDFGIFGGHGDKDAKEEEEAKILQTTIARVRPSDSAGWVLTTAEGAVWQMDNVPARLLTPKAGQPVEIRAGALSAYFIRINGQPGVKARRIG